MNIYVIMTVYRKRGNFAVVKCKKDEETRSGHVNDDFILLQKTEAILLF